MANGLAFMILVTLWLRRWGIKEEICWERDWGEEWGGSNPEEYNGIKDEKDFLSKAQAWQYVYNVKRPHFGEGMS